jgi:hypothetical protein
MRGATRTHDSLIYLQYLVSAKPNILVEAALYPRDVANVSEQWGLLFTRHRA